MSAPEDAPSVSPHAKQATARSSQAGPAPRGTPKMQPGLRSPAEVVAQVTHAGRRADAEEALALLEEISGMPPVLWGTSIIGVGEAAYATAAGTRGTQPLAAFAARSTGLVFYGLLAEPGSPAAAIVEPLLTQLGEHSLGKGCLYIKRLERVDRETLTQLIARAVNAAASPAPDATV